ncbi:MAG: hypothetical protein AADX96_25775 [Thiocapsa sp. C3-sup]
MLIERAVINAGPLVALSLIGRLDLLDALFPEFWTPDIIFQEVVVAGVGRPGSLRLAEESRLGKAKRAQPNASERTSCGIADRNNPAGASSLHS